ncbi:hypothetical protein [Maribellus sp. YY47]|uniref:hypothetical protein n=1 Tax=Maribellus sp. YY47 TaxID=2929486 RepID=UPI00200098C6|nr:hypothetical protein [Maribellus sp. YY47]MCK3682770.1 hypothetical protein [Maribellus sp. YY47]
MDLNDLKKTWDKLPAGKELDENQLRSMLSKRTGSLIERIDRNIRIGFLVLFVLILLFAFDDFLVSPTVLKSLPKGVDVPKWLIFLGIFSNALIFTTFIYFVIKYYRVRKNCDVICDLRETLKKIINTLRLYQRLFYLALATFMVAIGLAFISGLYEGVNASLTTQTGEAIQIDPSKLVLLVVIGLLVLVLLVGSVFLFLRWGFRKLYGNYIQKLKATLKELEGIEDENL